jgi:hypothetical protein
MCCHGRCRDSVREAALSKQAGQAVVHQGAGRNGRQRSAASALQAARAGLRRERSRRRCGRHADRRNATTPATNTPPERAWDEMIKRAKVDPPLTLSWDSWAASLLRLFALLAPRLASPNHTGRRVRADPFKRAALEARVFGRTFAPSTGRVWDRIAVALERPTCGRSPHSQPGVAPGWASCYHARSLALPSC